MNAATPQPLVLISPAMAIGSGYYRLVVEAFTRRGWEARALTRRGFEPDQPRASRRHDWSYADEIADMADAVGRARAEHPERPVLVLGHSLGGQVAAGHEATQTPVDGVVMVGAGVPHHRHFRFGGLPLAFMAGAIVPVATTLFGHLPKPAFGAPGARSLMREWALMVLTGEPPFTVERPLSTPSLFISLEGDDLAPLSTVDALADLFDPASVERWHHRDEELPEGASNDHVGWARTPELVVDRIVAWWQRIDGDTDARGADASVTG